MLKNDEPKPLFQNSICWRSRSLPGKWNNFEETGLFGFEKF
jgi:hypothetical protein